LAHSHSPESELINLDRRGWRKLAADKDARGVQSFQSLGEDVRADPGKVCTKITEPLGTQHQLAHHQQRPALAHEIERMSGSARVLVAAAGCY
jgi:hypothetical protein